MITTTYGSPGVAVGLSSSIHGALIDKVSYDEAGRLTALRFPAGGDLWRTQSYYPWAEQCNGSMLESLKVGLSEGGGVRLSRGYAYNQCEFSLYNKSRVGLHLSQMVFGPRSQNDRLAGQASFRIRGVGCFGEIGPRPSRSGHTPTTRARRDLSDLATNRTVILPPNLRTSGRFCGHEP